MDSEGVLILGGDQVGSDGVLIGMGSVEIGWEIGVLIGMSGDQVLISWVPF